MRFELMRENPIGFQVQPVNHSGKASFLIKNCFVSEHVSGNRSKKKKKKKKHGVRCKCWSADLSSQIAQVCLLVYLCLSLWSVCSSIRLFCSFCLFVLFVDFASSWLLWSCFLFNSGCFAGFRQPIRKAMDLIPRFTCSKTVKNVGSLIRWVSTHLV